MKALVLLLALLCTPAFAGFSSAVVGGGAVKSAAGSWSVKGAGSTAANGAFVTPATVTAAGQAVVIPATAAIAANAASFAISALRLNPVGLLVGLSAQWLLGQGLTYTANQWNKSQAGFDWSPNSSGGSMRSASMQGAANLFCQASYGINGVLGGQTPIDSNGIFGYYCPGKTAIIYGDRFCVGTNTKAVGPATNCAAQSVPAVESDFTAASVAPIPSNVAQELALAGVAIPVAAPVLSTVPQVVNYGSQWVDPATGKTLQTKTRITSDPTSADPYNVRIETYNIDIAAAPVPVPGDPVVSPEAEQPKDPCLDNPTRIGCLDSGSPEDVALGEFQTPFTLTPVTVGGAGNCPADTVLSVRGLSIPLKLAPICDAAGWLRPLILALAWFSAAVIVGGAVRES